MGERIELEAAPLGEALSIGRPHQGVVGQLQRQPGAYPAVFAGVQGAFRIGGPLGTHAHRGGRHLEAMQGEATAIEWTAAIDRGVEIGGGIAVYLPPGRIPDQRRQPAHRRKVPTPGDTTRRAFQEGLQPRWRQGVALQAQVGVQAHLAVLARGYIRPQADVVTCFERDLQGFLEGRTGQPNQAHRHLPLHARVRLQDAASQPQLGLQFARALAQAHAQATTGQEPTLHPQPLATRFQRHLGHGRLVQAGRLLTGVQRQREPGLQLQVVQPAAVTCRDRRRAEAQAGRQDLHGPAMELAGEGEVALALPLQQQRPQRDAADAVAVHLVEAEAPSTGARRQRWKRRLSGRHGADPGLDPFGPGRSHPQLALQQWQQGDPAIPPLRLYFPQQRADLAVHAPAPDAHLAGPEAERGGPLRLEALGHEGQRARAKRRVEDDVGDQHPAQPGQHQAAEQAPGPMRRAPPRPAQLPASLAQTAADGGPVHGHQHAPARAPREYRASAPPRFDGVGVDQAAAGSPTQVRRARTASARRSSTATERSQTRQPSVMLWP